MGSIFTDANMIQKVLAAYKASKKQKKLKKAKKDEKNTKDKKKKADRETLESDEPEEQSQEAPEPELAKPRNDAAACAEARAEKLAKKLREAQLALSSTAASPTTESTAGS